MRGLPWIMSSLRAPQEPQASSPSAVRICVRRKANIVHQTIKLRLPATPTIPSLPYTGAFPLASKSRFSPSKVFSKAARQNIEWKAWVRGCTSPYFPILFHTPNDSSSFPYYTISHTSPHSLQCRNGEQ